mgnify:FL=1|jgi:hypothetical protein
MLNNISKEEVELSVCTQWKQLGMDPFERVVHFTKITLDWASQSKENTLFLLKMFVKLVQNTTFDDIAEKEDVLAGLDMLIEERDF